MFWLNELSCSSWLVPYGARSWRAHGRNGWHGAASYEWIARWVAQVFKADAWQQIVSHVLFDDVEKKWPLVAFCGSVYSLFWYKIDKKDNRWIQGCKSLVTLKNLEENWWFILVLFLMTGSGDMDGLPKVRQILWLTLALACLFNLFLFFSFFGKNKHASPSSAELSQQHGGHEQSSRHSAGWRRDGRQLFKPIPKWKCEYWAQLRAS